MKTQLFLSFGLCNMMLPLCAQQVDKEVVKPNVILVYADDMGMGMLSCMGQKEFETPNIDRLFREGTQFTHAYAAMVSAASRASLLTGYFDTKKEKVKINGGPTFLFDPLTNTPEEIDKKVRQLEDKIDAKDVNLPQGDYYLPQVFKQAGYVTGQIGKLEYGWRATRKQMKAHGWDYYYGYLDHVACHGYYPPYLYENDKVVMIEGNTHTNCAKTIEPETEKAYNDRWNMTGKAVYSQDLFDQKMKSFIRENKDKPFFLYHPSLLPHGPVMIPAVHPQVKNNPRLTEIEKEYASMVIRLDSVVGMLMSEVEKQGIADRTMIIFASDNGHEIYYAKEGRVKKPYGLYDDWNTKYYSESHGDVFNGNAGMRGFKRQNTDGGIRVPIAFYQPGVIPSGASRNDFISICDLIPTFADMLHVSMPEQYKKDGLSIWKTLTKGKKLSKKRYITYLSYQGPAIVNGEGFKVRYNGKAKDYDMYNVIDDPKEEKNIAADYPKVFNKLKALLIKECKGDINNGFCYY